MALFNYATKEITLKIVYYGPGLSGKTTNLQYLHATLDPNTKGKLLSLSTESDRTLFFDFLPVEIGKVKDFSIRFQLYTVPGQVRYNATRKIVLKGADAVVFVADSQIEMKEQNIDSITNMMDNLRSNNINPDEIPIILQYNKRDLPNLLSIEELNADLNNKNYPVLTSSALNGNGVRETYEFTIRLLLKNISEKHKIEIQTVEDFEDSGKQSVPVTSSKPITVSAEADDPGHDADISEVTVPSEESTELPDLSYKARHTSADITAPEVSQAEIPVAGRTKAEPQDMEKQAGDVPPIHHAIEDGVELSLHQTEESTELSDLSYKARHTSADITAPEVSQAEMPVAGRTKAEPQDMEKQAGDVPPIHHAIEDGVERFLHQPEGDMPCTIHAEQSVAVSEKMDEIIEEIKTINTILPKIHDAFHMLSKQTAMMRKELSGLSELHKKRESRDFRYSNEMKKEQQDTNAMLRIIVTSLERLKIKKGWFRW